MTTGSSIGKSRRIFSTGIPEWTARRGWSTDAASPVRGPGRLPRVLRFTLLALASGLSLYTLAKLASGFETSCLRRPCLFDKDILQEYLPARAVLAGINPYLPLPDLARAFIGPQALLLPGPAAHPPTVVLLALPLAWLSYPQAALVWAGLEFGMLLASTAWLLRGAGISPTIGLTLGLGFLLLGTQPVRAELVYGQLSLLLLLLLLSAWAALRSGRAALGGALIGAAVALKLLAWPLVVLLALRRRWLAVVAAGGVWLGANLAAVLLMGPGAVADYYLRVGPELTRDDLLLGHNFALAALGPHLFLPTSSASLDGPVTPLADWPLLARLLSLAVPASALLVGLGLGLRARSLDTAVALVLCLSVVVSPAAWDHSLLLVLPALALSLRPPATSRAALLIATVLFVAPETVWRSIPLLLVRQPPVPAVLELANSLPYLLGVLGLLGLVWARDRRAPHGESAGPLARSQPERLLRGYGAWGA